MASLKYVHIAPPERKFILPLIAFLDKHFDITRHKFLLLGGDVNLEDIPQSYRMSGADFLQYLPDIYRAERVILHSILSSKLVFFLALQPWLLHKCNWIVWGADLYKFKESKSGLKGRVYEAVRRFVIKRFGYIVTGTQGDYELAKQWYGVRGQWIRTFNYTSNVFKARPLPVKEKNAPLIVVAGNSAAASNHHEKIFRALKPYESQNMRILCPLSYGDHNYEDEKENILKMGRAYFGDKFRPITHFMPLDAYLDCLAHTDIALYAHNRQQGLGNTLFLLGMGKTVYMEPDSALHTVFDEYDLIVKDINHFDFSTLSTEDKEQNITNVRAGFSEESLVQSLTQWLT